MLVSMTRIGEHSICVGEYNRCVGEYNICW